MIVGVIKLPVENVLLFWTKLILFPVPPLTTLPFVR
jgi:hypothetical protein